MALVYKDNCTNLVTKERSYAIHLLKQRHVISVYRDSVLDENYIEYWSRYLPKHNNFSSCDSSPLIHAPDTNMIWGNFKDKHRGRYWFNGCMPATKGVKYLKNYEVKR